MHLRAKGKARLRAASGLEHFTGNVITREFTRRSGFNSGIVYGRIQEIVIFVQCGENGGFLFPYGLVFFAGGALNDDFFTDVLALHG